MLLAFRKVRIVLTLSMTGAGLFIAFAIHAICSLVLHDGSSGPYPLPVQYSVGFFLIVFPILGLAGDMTRATIGFDQGF